MSMSEQTTPWSQPGWLEQASAWIEAALAGRGLVPAGPLEQFYTRPWSTVVRVPTAVGQLYFKAVSPWCAHETALTEALSRWRPDCTLPLLACDVARGWLLQPDGGSRLREVIRASGDFRLWEAVLPRYAELQRELTGRVPELLALGVPDQRLAALPGHYEQLLEDGETLRVGREHGLSEEEHARLRELAPRVRALCDELAAFQIPETLHHGDLGDGNVFLRDGQPRFFDWGDGVVAHPFFSLRTSFVSLYYSLGLDEGAPELDQLRDVYLASWADDGAPELLREAFARSRPLASIVSALGWHRIVSRLDGPAREEYAIPVPALLQEFLELVGG